MPVARAASDDRNSRAPWGLTDAVYEEMVVRVLKQCAMAALLAFVVPTWGAQDEEYSTLPDIGDTTGAYISPQQEKELGEAVLREFRSEGLVLEDPELEAYIESVGYRLVAQSDNRTIQFTFFVVRDPQINAFATPGGFVGVHTGLLMASQSESELAAVLAHEISHVTQRHGARQVEAASKLSLPSAAALLGAIALGALNPEAGQAAIAAVAAGTQQFGINFTRTNEYEADRIGINLLQRAGFDPFSMATFFERLQQVSRYSDPANYPVFLRTHPVTADRIAESRSRAEQFGYQPHADTLAYEFARARARVLTEDEPMKSVRFFEQQLRTGQFAHEQVARYGYALALTAAGDYGRAQLQVERLRESSPEEVAFLLAAARLAEAQNVYGDAIATYRQTLALYPAYRPALLGLADAQLKSGDGASARETLHLYATHHDADAPYYRMLSDAEGRAGSSVESHIALAEYYFASGNGELALEQLKIARHEPEVDRFQSQRIEARLAEIEALEKDRKKEHPAGPG